MSTNDRRDADGQGARRETDPTAVKLTRHFVTVGNRRVHYHRAGSGPALCLLHASACSAKVMRRPLEFFARHFTVLAFDTPGFGLSDLLPVEQVTTEDLADALAETLTVLGVEHTAVYGRHTGAQIAVEFAARHPARCAMALTDGFPIYTKEERERRLKTYLPPLVPTFEGGHLVWLWFRYRDQHVFWPWNAQDIGHRADTDVPDLDFLHRGAIEMLEAGDGYRIGYATAYRYRGLEVVPDLKVPVCFGGRPGDSQGHTPDMMPAGVWTQKMPRETDAAIRAECEVLRRHPARGGVPPAPACRPLPGRTTTDYLDVDGMQVLTRSMGDLQAAPPVVVLHQVPGSSALYDALIGAIGRSHPVVALDLPGHGESDPRSDGAQDVATWSADAMRVLDRLGIRSFHLYGHNGGAATAVEIARRHRDRVQGLMLDAPICLAESEQQIAANWLSGVLPVTPVWDGSHFLRVWHMRRDMELWWPWFDRRHENARDVEPRIDPARLTLEIREVMKQPKSFAPSWQSAVSYPMYDRLQGIALRCLLLAARQDVFFRCLARAQAARTNARVREVADSADARAAAIVDFVREC